MDFTPPKKIRKLVSGDVGTGDLCDEPKPRLGDSLTNRILQVKVEENESKSKGFEEESKNIAADFSSPPRKMQKIQSGDQLKSEGSESKRKVDANEEANSGEMGTNGLNTHKRNRKPDDENKTNETVTSPPKKSQKIDSLTSTYDHKICKVEASGNLNKNSVEETIGKAAKATVGNFDISESVPAKVNSENVQTVPDQSSGNSNLSSPSETQKSSCEKDPSSEKVDENKNVCLSGSVCEEIQGKNVDEKSQLKKESDRYKSTKDLQEDVTQNTDYRETDNEQRTINVDEKVRDDRIDTYKIDNGGKNTIESKESCKDFAHKSDESSMGRPKASTEKDINAVQNGRPIVSGTEGESPCVDKDSINYPHAAEEKDVADSMKTGICIDKEPIIAKDMEKTGENEENIPDLKVKIIKSSCDVSGFGESQNKIDCQNSATEFNETVSNKETKFRAESNDKLGDSINQSSLLNKDDLSDLDQYKKRQQSVEVGKDNKTVPNPGLSDLSRDKVKPDLDIRDTEADDNLIRSDVTNDWSDSESKKNVSLDNSKSQNSVKLTRLCDAMDNKTNITQQANECRSKDKRNEADEEDIKVADNMAVEQNDECMEHDDTVKNNVECSKERSETNSAENGSSEHQGENSTGKMECQLPENGQKKNITDDFDTVNSKLLVDKEGGVVLQNRDCQVSTKENKNNPISKNEETDKSDGVPEKSASEGLKHLGNADQKTVDNSKCKDSLKIKKAKLSDSETARTLDVDITPGFEQGQEFVKDEEIEKPESKETELNNGQTSIKDINTTEDATGISNDNPTDRNCTESVASVLDRENRKPDLLNLDKVNNAQNMKSEENVATDEPRKMVDGDMELDSASCQEDAKESGQKIDKIQHIIDDPTGQSNILKDGDQSDLVGHEAKLQGSAEIKEVVTDVKSSNETEPKQVANKTDKDDSMGRTDAVNDQPDKGINNALQDNECPHAIKQRSNTMNNQTLPDDEENGTTLQKDASSKVEENSTKKIDMVTEQDKCLEPSVIAEDNNECYDDSKNRGKNGGATDASNFATGRTPKERKEQYRDSDTAKGLKPNIPVNKTANSYSEGQGLAGIATNPHGTGKDDKDLSVSRYGKRLETAEDYKGNLSGFKETNRDDSIKTGADYTVDNDKPGGESDESMEVDTEQEKEVFTDTNQHNLGNDGLKIDDVEAGEGNEFLECDAVQDKDYTGANKEVHNESEKHYKSVDHFDELECQDITKGDKDACDSVGKNTFNCGEVRSPETREDLKSLTKDAKTVKSNEECLEPGSAEADSKDSIKNGNASSVSEKGDTFDSEGKGLDPLINNGRYTDAEKAAAEKASTNDESEDAKLSQNLSTKLETSNNETSKIANEHEETVIGSVSSVSASESCRANGANKNVKEITRGCREEKDSHTSGRKTSDSLKGEEKSAVVKDANHKTCYSLNDEATATSENEKINKNGSNCADRNAELSFEKNDKQLKYDDLKESGCNKVYLPEKINLKINDEPKKMPNSEDLKTEMPIISNVVANDSEQNKSVEISKDKVKSNVSENLEKQKMSVSKEMAEDITHNAKESRNDAAEDKISLEVETKDNAVNNEDEKKMVSLKDEENNGSVGCDDVIEPQVNLVATKDERKKSSGPENKNQESDTQNISEDRQNN